MKWPKLQRTALFNWPRSDFEERVRGDLSPVDLRAENGTTALVGSLPPSPRRRREPRIAFFRVPNQRGLVNLFAVRPMSAAVGLEKLFLSGTAFPRFVPTLPAVVPRRIHWQIVVLPALQFRARRPAHGIPTPSSCASN